MNTIVLASDKEKIAERIRDLASGFVKKIVLDTEEMGALTVVTGHKPAEQFIHMSEKRGRFPPRETLGAIQDFVNKYPDEYSYVRVNEHLIVFYNKEALRTTLSRVPKNKLKELGLDISVRDIDEIIRTTCVGDKDHSQGIIYGYPWRDVRDYVRMKSLHERNPIRVLLRRVSHAERSLHCGWTSWPWNKSEAKRTRETFIAGEKIVLEALYEELTTIAKGFEDWANDLTTKRILKEMENNHRA